MGEYKATAEQKWNARVTFYSPVVLMNLCYITLL